MLVASLELEQPAGLEASDPPPPLGLVFAGGVLGPIEPRSVLREMTGRSPVSGPL